MLITILALGLSIARAETVGFAPAKNAPVFCKFEPGRRLESERTPPPLTGFALPIYVKAPERDFLVFGELMMVGSELHDTPQLRKWAIERLVAGAKERGADAIWLVTPFAGRYVQAIVIKWPR